MGRKRPKVKYVLLPNKLMKKVEKINFTRMQKDKVIKLLSVIIINYLQDELPFDEYREFPSSYWKKTICAHYERVMSKLVLFDVLERKNLFYTNKSKEYRIKPDLLQNDLKVFSYGEKKEREHDMSNVCKKSRKVLRSCKLDKAGAYSAILSHVESGEIEESLNINEAIKVEGGIKVKYHKDMKPVVTSLESALNYAYQNNKDLIQDGKKFYITDKDEYITRKKMRVYYHYSIQCMKLNRKDIYANRNATNFRLDSNLTTLPSRLIPFFSLEKEPLVGIDLSNSQFVFLAVLIKEGYFDKYIKEARKSARKLILTTTESDLDQAHTIIKESNGSSHNN